MLRERIKAIFALHKGRYGYRRVTAAIRQPGQKINHKTVQRLMVEMGLKSLVRPKKYRSYRGDAGRVAPDLLKRQFQAEGPNQKWVTDITEFNVAGEKLYLSRDCQEFCARGRFRHLLTNLSPKTMANWVLASNHSRGGRFHSSAAWLRTRYSSFVAASSFGKWPLVRTARRNFEFSASMAFVV